ncbi:MAG: HIT family protein [Deferribacteraceae bacterium]|jgi:histidine triad (HIT) family protein|nr:HIT family protein [Deferribacteraceae bacterium]
MHDCIFCKIAEGKIPSTKVFEDEQFVVILDLYPVTKGHALLIPKEHHVNIFDVPEDIAVAVYPLLAKLARAVRAATGAAGMNIVQNNGEVSGQAVFHSHIHLIPRYDDDNLRFVVPGKTQASQDELHETATSIINALIKQVALF